MSSLTLWDKRFILLARHIGGWSKDDKKVGAVIVNTERRVVGLGFNGFPPGILDSPQRFKDKTTKRMLSTHAELNAILNATTAKLGDCTLYVTRAPCHECAKPIIAKGLFRVVAPFPDRSLGWGASQLDAADMLAEAHIRVSHYGDDDVQLEDR